MCVSGAAFFYVVLMWRRHESNCSKTVLRNGSGVLKTVTVFQSSLRSQFLWLLLPQIVRCSFLLLLLRSFTKAPASFWQGECVCGVAMTAAASQRFKGAVPGYSTSCQFFNSFCDPDFCDCFCLKLCGVWGERYRRPFFMSPLVRSRLARGVCGGWLRGEAPNVD